MSWRTKLEHKVSRPAADVNMVGSSPFLSEVPDEVLQVLVRETLSGPVEARA